MEKKEKKDLNCFIITPIGADNSDLYREAQGVYEQVIFKVLIELGFTEDKIAPVHKNLKTGSITKDIILGIYKADLIIANLSSVNPNVMYELAFAHAMRKRVIPIAVHGTLIPFDIKSDRLIFYRNDIMGQGELYDNLKKTVEWVLKEKESEISNPIFDYLDLANTKSLLGKVQEVSNENLNILVMEKIDRLASEINYMQKSAYTNIKYHKARLDSIIVELEEPLAKNLAQDVVNYMTRNNDLKIDLVNETSDLIKKFHIQYVENEELIIARLDSLLKRRFNNKINKVFNEIR